MFTGLIADVGEVAEVRATQDGARLVLRSVLTRELQAGDSIAVSGVCLTATSVAEGAFSADVMRQTLGLSSLGYLTAGSLVNLELALRAADRLGGHVVQGHVDGIATVTEVREEGLAARVTVALDPELLRYVVARGSIALDGVSLTVAELGDSHLTVSLIPETRTRTTLGELEAGRLVNVEVDVLAKHLERLLAPVSDAGSPTAAGGRA
ncbi:MAG TPA: riboflavin synthase [Solirubrobacteraceae bacterium]|nr:riboflavin synthase [Solirubrobacteraceae bacterium]